MVLSWGMGEKGFLLCGREGWSEIGNHDIPRLPAIKSSKTVQIVYNIYIIFIFRL